MKFLKGMLWRWMFLAMFVPPNALSEISDSFPWTGNLSKSHGGAHIDGYGVLRANSLRSNTIPNMVQQNSLCSVKSF